MGEAADSIYEQAREIAMACHYSSVIEHNVERIATALRAAIAAERERCAGKADEVADKCARSLNSAVRKQGFGARAAATAIREGKP